MDGADRKQQWLIGVIMLWTRIRYPVWDMDRLRFVKIIGMQFLDLFDFLTNSVMMPIAASDDKPT